MAARKPSAQSAAGKTKVRRKGCGFIAWATRGETAGRASAAKAVPSVHDVLCKPLAPLRGLRGTQLVIDDDGFALPLLRGREHAGKLGDFRIELRVRHHRASLLQRGDLSLHGRVEHDVDELVSQVGLL